jgi:hypothetical protein
MLLAVASKYYGWQQAEAAAGNLGCAFVAQHHGVPACSSRTPYINERRPIDTASPSPGLKSTTKPSHPPS